MPYFKGKDIPDLPKVALRTMQSEFKETAILVIDEKSMIGLEMLNMINKRFKLLTSPVWTTGGAGQENGEIFSNSQLWSLTQK